MSVIRIALVTISFDNKNIKIGESLGIKYLAASLQEIGHEVDLYEMDLSGMSIESLQTQLGKYNYSFIGFSVLFTISLKETISVAKMVRGSCPKAHFSIGGQGTSFLWKEILNKSNVFDSAVCFEGEITVLELVFAIENKLPFDEIRGLYFRNSNEIIFTGYREPITDLNSIPLPVRNEFSYFQKLPYFYMLTSRGCSAHCTFCCSGAFGNKYHNSPRWRSRCPKNILEEIKQLVNVYGVKFISFVDDDFLGACDEGPIRARNFIRELRAMNLKITWGIECRVNEVEEEIFREMTDEGLIRVLCGVDSGNTMDLKLFGKGATLRQAYKAVETIKSMGIIFQPGFIMFHPLSDLNRIKDNLTFLTHAEFAGYYTLTNKLELYAGSPLIKYYNKHCRIEGDEFTIRYEFNDKSVRLYYMILLECLKPFRKLESKISKEIFIIKSKMNPKNEPYKITQHNLSEFINLENNIHKFQLKIANHILIEVNKVRLNLNINDLSHNLIGDFSKESTQVCFHSYDKIRSLTHTDNYIESGVSKNYNDI